MSKQYWLMKSEPDSFSIADLERVKVEPWSGVRSYFARAYMRQMQVGDDVLFHHSSVDPPGVAGLARVVRTGVVDETQFDPASQYYDPAAKRETPTWDCVDVEYVKTLPHFVEIWRMRAEPALADMLLLKPGRLSVQPITQAHFERVVALGAIPAPEPPKKLKQPKPVKKPVTKAVNKPVKKPPANTKPKARR
ncbi:MAG: EVE domain-containing protein [Kofleriaceae bacterium]